MAPSGPARLVPPQWKIDDFWVLGFTLVSTPLSSTVSLSSLVLPLHVLLSLLFIDFINIIKY